MYLSRLEWRVLPWGSLQLCRNQRARWNHKFSLTSSRLPNDVATRPGTNGAFTPLVLFGGTNGFDPQASVAFGPDGNLYGTTFDDGAYGGGTIFRIVLTPQPQLAGVKKMPNGTKLITGTGPAASAFRLWATTNVSRPFSTWTLLTNSVFASDGTFSFTDTAANMPARFYRVSMP
jgi:uncharacterized repeat protein (TIGR03803 family)